MKWIKLKDFKCPSCGALLNGKIFEPGYGCTKCPFKISKEKFDEVVADIYRPSEFKTEMEKLEDWNNFGRKKVTEDFSDSKSLKK